MNTPHPHSTVSRTSLSLLNRVRSHEQQAWDRFTRLYSPMVYSWARRSGLQDSDAADIVQDVFAVISERLDRFDENRSGSCFRSWLWGVTRNKLLEKGRALQRQPTGGGGTDRQLAIQQIAVPEVEPAIQELLDKQAIYELSARYMRGLDRLDEAQLSCVFWEDGWCDYGFTRGTPAQFIAYALAALKDHAANQHMMGNVLIDLDGDQAYGEVYFQAYHKFMAEDGYQDMIIAGRYLDRYERRGEEWRFAFRSEVVDWSRSDATRDSYFNMAPDGLRGARQDDLLYDRNFRRKPG